MLCNTLDFLFNFDQQLYQNSANHSYELLTQIFGAVFSQHSFLMSSLDVSSHHGTLHRTCFAVFATPVSPILPRTYKSLVCFYLAFQPNFFCACCQEISLTPPCCVLVNKCTTDYGSRFHRLKGFIYVRTGQVTGV